MAAICKNFGSRDAPLSNTSFLGSVLSLYSRKNNIATELHFVLRTVQKSLHITVFLPE